MAFTLSPLPYAENALEPHMSGDTLALHHGAHHKTYVETLNKLVEGTPLAQQDLVQVIRATAGKAEQKKIFNNAAQVWNHDFFFRCLKPQGGGKVEIVTTPNAETPIAGRDTPLLTCDVWEHAYYVDHRNRRAAFLDTFLGHLVNWEFAAAQLR